MKIGYVMVRSALRGRSSMRALAFGLSGALAGALAALPAAAQTAPNLSAQSSSNLDLGSVLATGSAATNDGDPSIPGTPANEAPTRGSLRETQPTSVVGQTFIDHSLTPSVNYAEIMALSPSASSTDQSGPGLDESKHDEMRGFQDGFYNVTFDGIPYGDSNDFTHHTTTFFMANDIGEEIIDRGPGTASTIGNATFGGTVAIVSKDPLAQRTLTPYGTYGSYNTYIGGTEFDTGVLPGGGEAFFDGEDLGSDTFSQHAAIDRTNTFSKYVQPIGHNFVFTLVGMFNETYQQYDSGGTLAQIAAYGPSFALSNNPLSQNYKKYNTDHYNTDFEYADLRGNLGYGWSLDAKIYTYGYYHHSLNGVDSLDCGNDACTGLDKLDLTSKVLAGATATTENAQGTVIPGQFKYNTYRSFGTITRFQNNFELFGVTGDAKAGLWYDHQQNTRALVDENLTTGIAVAPVAGSTEPFERLMHDTLDTFQPYYQLDLHPIPGLTISPGVKWDYFKRGINAPVNQKTLKALGYEKDYTKLLPSAEANYAITPQFSAYVQYAQGFLAPNLNVLYSNPTGLEQSSLQPQTTTNYQAGLVYQSSKFAGDADVYYIPFSNLATSTKINGNTVFYNGGGAIYKGIEAEGTYQFAPYWNAYLNGSLNAANYSGTKGHNHVAETPDATWAAGLIYDDGMFNGSLTSKWTGAKYGVDSNASATTVSASKPYNLYGFDPYAIVNLSLGVDLHRAQPKALPIVVSLNVDNIADDKAIYDYAGLTSGYLSSGAKDPNGAEEEVYTLPGRSVFLNVKIPLQF